MATHSSTLAWRIPWTEEPGGYSPWDHKESDMTEQLTHNIRFMCVLVAQSCLTLSDTMDWGPPGSSIHGIFQARILEWVANPFSRGSF